MRHAAGSPLPPAADPRTDGGANPRVSSGPYARVSSGPNPRVSSGLNPRVSSGLNPRVSSGPDPRVSTGLNPRVSTEPDPRVSTAASTAAVVDATQTDETPAKGRRRAATRTWRPRRRRSLSVMLAIAAAVLLVVVAAGTLVYTVLHTSPKPGLTGQSSGKPSPTGSPSPGLGPYGDIASRQTDPQPLTLAELFPPSFIAGGVTVTNAATSLTSDCASALIGATLQSAAGAADCTQVARATYVDPLGGVMATIGVLNLSTGDAAKVAAQSADANNFIGQLTTSSGPAQAIGQGTGIEEALAKGHYLILVWAELTELGTPTAQQSTNIEAFMTQLVQATANKDLTTRMLTGAP